MNRIDQLRKQSNRYSAVILLMLAAVIAAACFGQMDAEFTPAFQMAPVSWGIIPYTLYLLIPSILHMKEAVQWHISRSGI